MSGEDEGSGGGGIIGYGAGHGDAAGIPIVRGTVLVDVALELQMACPICGATHSALYTAQDHRLLRGVTRYWRFTCPQPPASATTSAFLAQVGVAAIREALARATAIADQHGLGRLWMIDMLAS